MKIVIFGSRDLSDEGLVFTLIEDSVRTFKSEITEVVSGGARGIDRIAEKWARANKIQVSIFEPDWDGLGKRAGFARNIDMANYADRGLGLWDGTSPGTKQMIEYLKKIKKSVEVVNQKPFPTGVTSSPQPGSMSLFDTFK